jgi:phosphoenolpyruvate carboxykinase (ATP)
MISIEREPEIFDAIRFGTVLENVIYDPITRIVDFSSSEITENTRAAYPIEYIPNSKVPGIAGHPKHIIMLTCDAFGVLPPVSRLSTAQAMYHFISGYTAKIAGTEEGIKEPTATFSACFGQPFLVWHPVKYAQMLAEKMHQHQADAWLINTGWTGGMYGVGKRIPLKYSRAIIDAIHSGELVGAEYETYPIFKLAIPKHIMNIPDNILNPCRSWPSTKQYWETITKLCRLFNENFQQYVSDATPDILAAAPEPNRDPISP